MVSVWHDLPAEERSSVTVHDQDPYSQGPQDSDPEETSEWQESLQQLVEAKGLIERRMEAFTDRYERSSSKIFSRKKGGASPGPR